jgi:hypothetical protein
MNLVTYKIVLDMKTDYLCMTRILTAFKNYNKRNFNNNNKNNNNNKAVINLFYFNII